MQFKGRIFAIGVVALFNVMRYIYYHVYLELKFEASFFILLVVFLSISWWSGKQYDRAKYYSEKDPLTNTYNRRMIEILYPRIKDKCLKRQNELAILMIDLDDFKKVNDHFGHQAGDRLLLDVAKLLQDTVKEDGFVARWGGDEFLILMPKTNQKSALNFINLLESSKRSALSPDTTKVGKSVGYAIMPDDGLELEELMRKADQRMYEKKKVSLRQSV